MKSVKLFVSDEVHQDLKMAAVLRKETVSDIIRNAVKPVLQETRLEMKLQALKETERHDQVKNI